MSAEIIDIHNRNPLVRLKAVPTWNISDEDKKDIPIFIDELSLGKVNRGKRISEARQLKYLDILKIPFEFFRKPSRTLDLKDVERFERALESDKLISARGKPFAASTKADIRRILTIYLRWKLGNGDHFRQLCGWLDLRSVHKTPDFISESDVERLYNACRTAEERFLLCMLFDGGMRATEFHNVRYADIQLPSADQEYVQVTLKEEYSKTLGRTISLYWKHSASSVIEYVRERQSAGVRADDAIYASKYDASRQMLYRLGKRVLKRSIGYHLFRHSSATYYAAKLNRQQLCYRYGWRFSSNMPDVYISRAGMANKELDEKFASGNIDALTQQLDKYKQEMAMLKDWKQTQENDNSARNKFDPVLDKLLSNPKFRKAIGMMINQSD